MFKTDQYVPILSWKLGEQAALSQLTPDDMQTVVPCVEIAEIPIDVKTGKAKRTLEGHAQLAIKRLQASWKGPLLLDPLHVESEVASKVDGATHIFEKAVKAQLDFVPVTGLTRTWKARAAAFACASNGLCLRLTTDDFDDGPPDLSPFLKEAKLKPEDVDCIIDLSDGIKSDVMYVAMAKDLMHQLPHLTRWRSLAVAATSFPRTMGDIGRNSAGAQPRHEWVGYLKLCKSVDRVPTFSDYGIQNPVGIPGFDPRYMSPSAAIRYTRGNDWQFVKGVSIKDHGGAQFALLAKHLVKSAHFHGEKHCGGCYDIKASASGRPGLSSSGVWRRIGTCHHVTVVREQLSKIAP